MRVLHPHKGYLRDFLWVPKESVGNEKALRASLTFELPDGREVVSYLETDHHYIVPRAYLSPQDLEDLEFEVIDRSVSSFPEVVYRTLRGPRDQIQSDAAKALLEGGSGLLVLACGRGKTFITIYCASQLAMPLLVVVHTIDIALQWKDEILKHTDIPEEDIGWVQGGTQRWEGTPICIATVQSLVAWLPEMPEAFRRWFGIVAFDEAHHMGAPAFNQVAHIGHGLRWGITATPDREDGLNELYINHLGPIHYENLEQDVPAHGWVIPWDYQPTENDFYEMTDKTGQFHHGLYCVWLATCTPYVNLLVDVAQRAVQEGHVVLIASSGVDLLKVLHERIDGSGLLIGERSGADRRTAKLEAQVILAQMHLAKEALNRVGITTVIAATQFGKKGAAQQLVGRGQRKAEGKDEATFIFFDPVNIAPAHKLSWKMRHNLRELGIKFNKLDWSKEYM